MTFEWKQFLDQHGIPYTNRAHNLTRGNLGCACPLCDWPDKSPEAWRLGISTTGRGWSCWSNKEHSGIRPHRLVQAFLKCSWAEALQIVGQDGYVMPAGNDRDFGDMIANLMTDVRVAPAAVATPALSFEAAQLHALQNRNSTAYRLCFAHLTSAARGYLPDEAHAAIRDYDLRCTLSGPFRYRIVFPIEHPEGLVSWQGRTVLKDEPLRYKALSSNPEKAKKEGTPTAAFTIVNTLWRAKQLYEQPDDTLVVCEGPMDAMRIDFFGRKFGVRATCLFGKALSVDQAVLLSDIAPLYRRRILMLDRDALADGIRARDRLDFLRFETMTLDDVKDPGMLSREQIKRIFTH